MKRFATDVLRVLKAVNGTTKQVEMDEFPNAYKQLFSKPFAPEDYGLCSLSDLVAELVGNSSLVTLTENESGNLCLTLPRRTQTSAELQKLRAFELEVSFTGVWSSLFSLIISCLEVTMWFQFFQFAGG